MKLLKQKSTGEIYVWTENLSKRDDMEPFERVAKPTIVLPPEPTPKETVDEVVKEEVNEAEASVGEAKPEEAKQEAKPKSKSPSKGKR